MSSSNFCNSPRNAYFFPVNIQESRLALQLRLNGPVWLRIDPDCIALLEQETWNDLIECPLGCIRKSVSLALIELLYIKFFFSIMQYDS